MKKIGIGYEDYREFIDRDMYYIDKTDFIRNIVSHGGKVSLFTRPRRFGKTLALSMLRTFFEKEYDRDGNIVDKRRYFEGKKIMEAPESILSMMGQYPVINLSLKSAKQPDFYTAFIMLRDEIISEYSRHGFLKDSKELSSDEKNRFNELLSGRDLWREREKDLKTREQLEDFILREAGKYAKAIRELSDFLKKDTGKNVIILIDEYDVPLENAYFAGFYDKMIGFIRSLFESALKTNDALEFAVVTGCLRISKESIFTGLNNLDICSIGSSEYGEYFGFTREETAQMLIDYGMPQKEQEVMDWYDGYDFGGREIINPWSVTKYVKEHVSNIDAFPEPYWSNTSSNSIIKELVYAADEGQKRELERLIDGGTIEKQVHEDITYDDIHESEDNLWNFLFFTGYMKRVSERHEDGNNFVTMKIPNREVRYIYANQISVWFDREIKKKYDRSGLYEAIIKKDGDTIAKLLTALMKEMISTFDSSESFYHGFFLSLLGGMDSYAPQSNREEGDGRPDVILYPEDAPNPAYIFEIKAKKKFNEVNAGLQEAFDQIDEKRYEDGIIEDGYAGVISFGMCFCKKSCAVKYKGEKWA